MLTDILSDQNFDLNSRGINHQNAVRQLAEASISQDSRGCIDSDRDIRTLDASNVSAPNTEEDTFSE